MHRLALTLVSVVFVGCTTLPPGAPERWLTKHQTAAHYHHSELAPERRMREVPESMRAEAVSSLKDVPFRKLSDAEFAQYGGSGLERLRFQGAYLLRAVRPVDRPYRFDVYRDHVEHHGHVEPPETVSTVARAGGTGIPTLAKTAVVYIDSRPPEKLNVDYLRTH